jgi:integrase
VSEALTLVDATSAADEPYERLRQSLLPQFLAPVVSPSPDDVVLWGRRCAVANCEGWDCHGAPELCAQHRKRLHYLRTSLTMRPGEQTGNDVTREQFVVDGGLNGGPVAADHPGFDFTGLPETLELELRLLVQERSLRRETYLRRHEFMTIRKTALAAGLTTLLIPELRVEERWLRTLPIPAPLHVRSGQVVAHVRFAVSVICDTAWPVPLLERDRWYEHDFDSDGSKVKTITWTGFEQAWLKAWVKRWAQNRLAAGWKFSTAVANVSRLLPFSRFLAEDYSRVQGPAQLSRQLLLDYIAWVRRQPSIAASQRQALVSALKILIEDYRLNQWHPAIPESAVLRHGELPRREEMLPRPIDAYVLRQILDEQNLAQAKPELRTQLLIFDGHGLRIGSIVELRIDCLGEDADGFPTLRWRNTKRGRERLHPIRLLAIVEAIQQQAERARRRHPSTPWLFPHLTGNPLGERHTTTSALRDAFDTYLRRVDVRNRDGTPARVTPHQFRHTFGTRELNNGASQEVVQELLDHDDPGMTRGYARLSGERLREEFVAAARFKADGERLESLLPDSPLADVAWMKERLNRARVTLPNGYCSLPLQQTCEVQNACLDCSDYFVTTPEFLPAHEAQHAHTAELIQAAEETGQTRIAEKNRVVLIKLEALISSLREAQ